MSSTTQRGNYYKAKTKKYYEDLGYTVQITEFMCGLSIPGRTVYRKIDIFGSDGISLNGTDIIFWNSKHCSTKDKNNINTQIRDGKKEFAKYPFPKNVKLHLVMWEPRKKPYIIECN